MDSLYGPLDEEKKKAGTESSKESSLRDWFGRKGAKGSKKCKNPPCANDLSRKKWKCRGSKSMKE